MKHVMVTGGGGYIGSVMVALLLSEGYRVTIVDRFFFGDDLLGSSRENPQCRLVRKDIRDLVAADFDGIDVVCDLAALSNDPSGDIDQALTYQINYEGRVHVAGTAKAAGVSRYILSSSCSVYGSGGIGELDETSGTSPLTAYADSTLKAEAEILPLGDDGFCATALRNATVFGLSPRMRFDLVINLMTLHAVQNGRIIIMGGGRQWRPLVHVCDVARAFRTVFEAEPAKVNGEVFNVGLRNFQIRSLAYIVRETLPFPLEVQIAPDDPDKRSYNVSFGKMRQLLGFEAETSVEEGIKEVYDALKFGEIEQSAKTSTVGWYRSIIEAKKLLESVELGGRVI